MKETVRINDMVRTLKRRWKFIVLTTLCVVLISAAISYFVLTPIYQASTQILVNQKDTKHQLDVTQLSSNVNLINTYSVIIKSPAILEKVIENLKLTENIKQINEKITIDNTQNSQVFSLTVEDRNPVMATKIANSVSETFQKEIPNIMNVDNVSILAKAEFEDQPTPVKPNPLLNMAIACVVGLMTGIGLAFLLEFMDSTLKDDHDIEEYLKLPVLGSISKISQIHKKGEKGTVIQKLGGETM